LHLWSVVLGERVSLWLIARFVSLFMTTAFVANSVYGILVSVAIRLYRSPFLLQPISVFGFSSLEAVVIFINCLVAWIGYLLSSDKRPSLSVVRKPLIILAVTIAVWCSLAGIIWGTASSVATVSVATMNRQSLYPIFQKLRADRPSPVNPVVELGEAIALLAKELSPNATIDIIVLDDAELSGLGSSCQQVIAELLAPPTKGMKSMITLGCVDENKMMAYTLDTDNPYYLHRHAKMRTRYFEKSEDGLEYSTFEIPAASISWNEGVAPYSIRASSLIGSEVECTDAVSKSVDRGASIIVNPSGSWKIFRDTYPVSVIRAVEDRVPVIKADSMFDSIIVDPFGRTLASGGDLLNRALFVNNVPISTPLEINYPRQLIAGIVFMVCLVAFLVFDFYTLYTHRMGRRATY
jgi:apolipoprotein N-acyltransferase